MTYCPTQKEQRSVGQRVCSCIWSAQAPATEASSISALQQNFKTGNGVCVPIGEYRLLTPTCDRHEFMCAKGTSAQGGRVHALCLLSSKSKRLSYSTSHGETHAAARILPHGDLVALCFTEPGLCTTLCKRMHDGILPRIQHDDFIDCIDLWDRRCGHKGNFQDKRSEAWSSRHSRRATLRTLTAFLPCKS